MLMPVQPFNRHSRFRRDGARCQNFTADAARLKQVVAGLKTSAVTPNAPSLEVASLGPSPIGAPSFGMPQLSNAEADFGARSVMLALRSLAKSLGSVPGRKTLVMLTSGFPITPEIQSELTAVISVCNRYNVAIYPLDVRGLVAPGNAASPQGWLMPDPLHHDWDSLGLQRLRTLEHGIRIIHLSSRTLIPDNMAVVEAEVVEEVVAVTVEEAAVVVEATARLGVRLPEGRAALEAMAPE